MKHLTRFNENSWVNIKIDRDVFNRVKRFISAVSVVGDRTGVKGLEAKLKYIGNPRKPSYTSTNEKIQEQMGALILLRYLNELKNNFDATSAGKLLESFIAGLVGGEVLGDNGPVDIQAGNQTYQIKFYDFNSNSLSINPATCNHYIIALKNEDMIYIWRLSNTNTTPTQISIHTYMNAGNTALNLTSLKDRMDLAIELDVSSSSIEDRIERLSAGLNTDMSKIWKEIASLQENVESIVTGVAPNNERFSESDYLSLYDQSSQNLKNLQDHLVTLKGSMGTRR